MSAAALRLLDMLLDIVCTYATVTQSTATKSALSRRVLCLMLVAQICTTVQEDFADMARLICVRIVFACLVWCTAC